MSNPVRIGGPVGAGSLLPLMACVWSLAGAAGHAGAERKARDDGERRASNLWDRVLYPAEGRYRDLLSAARRALSGRRPTAAQRTRALQLIRAALRLSPRRPQAWRLLGELRAGQGRYARAAKAYARAHKLDPHYRPRNLTYAFAMASLRAGHFARAARAFLSLLRPKDTARIRSILLTNAAEAYAAAGHLRRAIELYRRAITGDLRYTAPRWGLAVAQHRAGKPRLAVRLAAAALQMDPRARALLGPQALYAPPAARHYHLALLYEARKEPARARLAWQAYLKARPRSPWRPQVQRALSRLPATALPDGGPRTRARPRRGSGASSRGEP
jgi:tetratricopeptide (TPR) repeat protein